MKNLKEAFGLRLKEIRKSKKYTQEVLAEMIDLSPRQLIRIENGENFPSVEVLGKISLVLNIGLDSLFDFQWNEDIMYFNSGVYNKPVLKVVYKGEDVIIKQVSRLNDEPLQIKNPIDASAYEEQIFNFCKRANKPINVEFFESKKRVSIKTFYPNGQIDVILSKEDILNNELYNYIIKKLKKISFDSNKLTFIKIALDSLDDKKAIEELSSIVQGMKLVLQK